MPDAELAERLRRTFFEGDGTERLRPTVRVPCEVPGHLTSSQLDHLFALLGVRADDDLLVGWFAGGATYEYAELLGPPDHQVCLIPTYDLDWHIWRRSAAEVRRVAAERFDGPNLLFSPRDGWMVFLSPTQGEAHLSADPAMAPG